MASETGYILRHAYSNACHAARVQDSDRMLLIGQQVGGIRGAYLNDRYLLDHLLEEQEKVTAYLLGEIAPATSEAKPEKKTKRTAEKRKKTARQSAGSSRK